MKRKDTRFKNILFKMITITIGIYTIFVSLFIFGLVFFKGYKVVDINFLTDYPKGIPLGSDGGIFPAIEGSLILALVSSLIASPIAIKSAIKLVFYKDSFNIILKKSVEILSGIPSIIYGLIGYSIFIMIMDFNKSLLVSAFVIAIMIIPFIIIRVKKILQEEASIYLIKGLGLGLSKEYIIRKIIMPKALPDIISSIALAASYGMGAVAPIMYTGVVMNQKSIKSLTEPFMALPYHLYILVTNGFAIDYAYATALVLLVIILLIQIFAKILPNIYKNRRNNV